ncbi:hypothetical protein Smp_141600 [Schistosoma mansoni]|uniref:hypothetical protein n=1 Tax=Schistosoma mansoni TaxID=6183 RepID=UPI00022DBFA4|nr:hypothetical protein Smp_141600 [Schistosoma mansoni]|eukprot:XP_018651606.1 hypothetical protein Smp_141600 [Schistosoma mansoni]
MSLLKGVLELETIELEENALMELLDLPTWLLLRKAHCTNVVAKIHWTKLKTHPVLISIDHINIELQALDEPRPASQSPTANYRGGSGKYGFSDKVIDGVTIQVNSVFIEFFAQAFQGSVELSRFCVLSKSPNWQNCLLNLSTLTLPQYDSILMFKEVSWESARIVADGLLTELHGTPVKLITNQSRVRLTMKKRLSDGSLISSRIRLILDDILWVFTLSQVEAAIVFARSLEHSIRLANEQSKRFAAEKAKFFYLSKISWIFIHFTFVLEIKLNPNIVPNGSMRVNLTILSIDWYPYHLDLSPELPWPGCREFHSARDNWLKGINPIHFTYGGRKVFSTNSSTVSTDNQFVILDCGLLQTVNTSILQSVGILRLVDITVSCVSYPNFVLKPGDPSTLFSKSSQTNKTFFDNNNSARIKAEIPIDKNLFIGSDKLLHNLPDTSSFLTIEFKNYYCVDNTPSPSSSNQSLPCSLFCQINPFYINFDPDTVIWLNTFLLALQSNLSTFLCGRDMKNPSNQSNRLFDLNRYHVRLEALMPRLIFSLFGQSNRHTNSSNWIGPHALILQSDQIIVQSLAAPISSHVADCLKKLLDNLQLSYGQYDTSCMGNNPFISQAVPHKSPDLSKFQKLVQSATELHSLCPNFEEQFWCIHCPNVWSEFLTIVDMTTYHSVHLTNNDHRINDCVIYRQSLIESLPLTIWSLIPINISMPSTVINDNQPLNHSPISLIIDIDNKLIPMDSKSSSSHMINQSVDQYPIKFSLGSTDQLHTNRILLSRLIKISTMNSEKLRIPDTLDQIIFLYYIYQQISYVQTRLCLDYQAFTQITESRSTLSISPQSNHNYHKLLCCVGFSTLRSIELDVNVCHHQENEIRMKQVSSPSFTENNIDTSLQNTPNVSATCVNFFPNKSLSTTSLSSSSSPSFSTKFSHNLTPLSAAAMLPLSSQTSLCRHHSMFTPSWDSLSLKTEGSVLDSSKSNRTNLRKSMRGRINSSDDSPQFLSQNDSDRGIGTTNGANNNSNRCTNKLVNSDLSSPKMLLMKRKTHSTVTFVNKKNECNGVDRNKQSQNKPLSEQDLFMLNPVADGIWANNSSTNNISQQFSISSDLSDLQSISSSMDDWTKPYEVLSNLNSSCTYQTNDMLWPPLNHQHLPNSSSFLLSPDEIAAMEKYHEPKSEENITDHDRFRRWKKSNMSSVIIQLTGFSFEADAMNLETRLWIVFKSLQLFMKPEESFHCSIASSRAEPDPKQHDEFVQSDYLWSIFLSFGGDPTLEVTKLKLPTSYIYPWLYANATLLKDWRLIIPSNIQQLFIHLFLQQGLIIELTEYGVFQIAFDKCTVNMEQVNNMECVNHYRNRTMSIDKKLLSFYSPVNTPSDFHNILINRYAFENKILKDKIEALTNELMKLRSMHNA